MIETMLRTIIRVYTPLKMMQEKAVHWVYSWVPYFLYEVEYNPSDTEDSVINIYNSKRNIPWVKQRFGKLDGYLSFKYWNHDTQEPERIILHTNHVIKALQIDSIENIWAYSEEGMILLFHEYMKKNKQCNMIDIRYGDTDIYREYRSLLPSICLSKNVTPVVLARFLKLKENSTTELVYYDEDVKEVRVNATENILH